MTAERIVRLVAGTFVLASVALGYWVSPWFLAFTAFVGLNLFQFAFTNVCPLGWALRKLGVPYTDEEIAKSTEEVKGKTELEAVIAYLQNLGTAVK